METIDYSVIIRTVGSAGQKYQALLDSVAALEPQPKEVIVVLPEGYAKPKEQLGWETFYYSPKGMVNQRSLGIRMCKTKYALVCDDDICFGKDFVRKLYEPLWQVLGTFSIAPLYEMLPSNLGKYLVSFFTAKGVPTLFHRGDRYISVLRSSGFSYNRHMKPGKFYETQSAPGACFFADTKACRSLDFGAELWLQSGNYAFLEDQTLYYKACLRGKRVIAVPDASYKHLDAKSARTTGVSPSLYPQEFNRIVFWHRFIYSQQRGWFGRVLTWLCFGYLYIVTYCKDLLYLLIGKNTPECIRRINEAHRDAWAYIRSEEYASLEPVR